MPNFTGRSQEINKILKLKKKNTASLVVLMGRRRIGKSTLVEEVGKNYKKFINIAGLAPHPKMTNQDQLNNFYNQLQEYSPQKKINRSFDWYTALSELADLTKSGEWLILLDEISWMGAYDVDFPGQLKVVWDKKLKKNNSLNLVVCGSVSAWIDENILKNADFVGRISLQMNLEELELKYCNEFWKAQKGRVSPLDKLKLLSITGGVPKYLEEIIPQHSAEQNIIRLCFDSDSSLLHEFDKIFNEIFNKRNLIYNKIVRKLAEKKMSMSDLARSLKVKPNGDFSDCLFNLEISGFIKKDFVYSLKGQQQGLSRYRLKDNYLRFYFKYIEPNKEKIINKTFIFKSVYQFSNWESTVGLQFENLILQNLQKLYEILGLRNEEIISANPYFQKKTARTKGACQIDIMIVTKNKTIYVCELKVKNEIDATVIKEVQNKIKTLRLPHGYSLRPILIYEGLVNEKLEYELKDYFDELIKFDQFLV